MTRRKEVNLTLYEKYNCNIVIEGDSKRFIGTLNEAKEQVKSISNKNIQIYLEHDGDKKYQLITFKLKGDTKWRHPLRVA